MYIISAVLEKEHTRAAIYDKKYNLLAELKGEASTSAKLCEDIISKGGIKACDVEYVGVAADSSFGAPDAIAAELERTIGIKCYGASIMNARALGEAYTANDRPSLFLLKIDDTIECGIVIDKKVYSGINQLGGKIAHTVIDFGGYECSCGRCGCFEAYAGNSGLRRIAAESGVEGAESITHAKLFAMATPEAERAKRLYVEYLASGITDVINLFQPHELVLEGPFTKVGDALMNPMMEIILREQYSSSIPNKCNIRFSNTDTDTALIGAALLGR